MKNRLIIFFLIVLLILTLVPTSAFAADSENEITVLFTSDLHSYMEPTEAVIQGTLRERGGAARIASIIKRNSDANTLILDGGDFSMGTLFQSGYLTDAYELRALGMAGTDVTTFGNHEWDFGGYGVAQMLDSALKSGDHIPQIVQSNIRFDGTLTDEQKAVKEAFERAGVQEYLIKEVDGVKVAIFGLMGYDCIDCAPTSGLVYEDYIECAKRLVPELRKQADIVICLSHSGNNGKGEGEDYDLAREVPGLDLILSGHSHSFLFEAGHGENGTLIVSPGEYGDFVGKLKLKIAKDGSVSCPEYELIPVDSFVREDNSVAKKIADYKQTIEAGYLKDQLGPGYTYDTVIAHCGFNFLPLDGMYATHDEFPMGNLIADSYMYEAKRNGIDNIDVALVGLGTIRGSFHEGDITVSDAFEMCSLGAGGDGTAGHPIIGVYATGAELKLLVELDASLGPLVSSIKMSYSGLRYTFNTDRMLLDRVTECYLVRPDGSEEEIEDDKLYYCAANMYAANMLGMVNDLTRGVLKIVPKYADGSAVEDLYTCSLLNKEGKEIKEWVAFEHYLESFGMKEHNVPEIPVKYSSKEGRKLKVSEAGLARIKNPGTTTQIVMALIAVLLVDVVVRTLTYKKRREKRRARRAKRKAKRNAKKEK